VVKFDQTPTRGVGGVEGVAYRKISATDARMDGQEQCLMLSPFYGKGIKSYSLHFTQYYLEKVIF